MKFAIIGSNYISDWMLDAGALCPGFEPYALYSRTQARAREYGDKRGIPVRYTDLDALAADPAVEAVYVASPTCCHAAQSIQMLRAGKHVLCEKPVCSNERELKAMIAAARERHVVLLEAMRSEYTPGFAAVRDNLPKLGALRRATLRFCQYSGRYDNFKKGIIENAFKPELSNGAIMDIGVYVIHAMVSLFGSPQWMQADVIKLSNGADGAGSLIFHYEDMQGEIAYSKITNSSIPSEIQGEDGNMLIDHIQNPEKVEIRYRDGRSETLFDQPVPHNMRYEITRFMQYAQRGAFPEEDLRKSLDTMAAIDAIRERAGIRFPADEG